MLTSAAECFKTMMYPFDWSFLYIPYLPRNLFQYLQCPTPFIIGIDSRHAEAALTSDGLDRENLIVVDFDLDEVRVFNGPQNGFRAQTFGLSLGNTCSVPLTLFGRI